MNRKSKNIHYGILFILSAFTCAVMAAIGYFIHVTTISNCKIKLSDEDFTYTGNPCNLKLEIESVFHKKLTIDKDCTVDYQNNIHAGMATAIIHGKGLYRGRKIISYEIKKADQDLQVKQDFYDEIITAKQAKIEVTNSVSGDIIYESMNPDVVEVDDAGNLDLKSVGYADINVHSMATDDYKSDYKTISVVVEKAEQAIKIKKISFMMNLKSKPVSINATSVGDGEITYSVKDANIVSVSDKGVITPKKAGKTRIVIKVAGTEKYNESKREVSVTVSKIKPEVTIADTVTASVLDGFISLNSGINMTDDSNFETLTGISSSEIDTDTYRKLLSDESSIDYSVNSNGAVSFNSLNDDVVSVAGNKLMINNTGSTKVVMNIAETDMYEACSKEFTVSISDASKEALSRAKGRAAARWAIEIAADNDFHYGVHGPANHHGCYFCGTNGPNSVKVKSGLSASQALKSYCCNPFVTAAWCHGAANIKYGMDITKYVSCTKHKINLAYSHNSAVNNKNAFEQIHPSGISDLQPGDILLNKQHAWLYVGNGMLAEASGGDDGKVGSKRWNNSIHVKEMSQKNFNKAQQIFRYIGG